MTAIVRIHDIMTTNVMTFTPEMEINLALKKLLDKHYSGAPVIGENGFLIGVLSQKDCLKAVLNTYYHQTLGGLVEDYMTIQVETMDPELELAEAAQLFVNSHYRRFPVIKNEALVGQVSRCDVLRSLSGQWI